MAGGVVTDYTLDCSRLQSYGLSWWLKSKL